MTKEDSLNLLSELVDVGAMLRQVLPSPVSLRYAMVIFYLAIHVHILGICT
jgi:hypothetical protein